MRTKTQEDIQRQRNSRLIKDVLGDTYISFSHGALKIMEFPDQTRIQFQLLASTEKRYMEEKKISGSGKGLIDAMFKALLLEHVTDCVSIADLRVHEFYIFVDRADLRRHTRSGETGAAAMAQVCLQIDNGAGGLVPFRSYNNSVISAMAEVVLSAFEFFINSEKAMRDLRSFIEDAKSRRRSDLVDLYTYKMAELVKNTSYEKSFRGEE